jgi:hypothetical protein
MRDLGDRTPYLVDTFISAEPNPHAANGNWTLGSGNLSEQSGVGPGTIAVKNNTCADYFIRIVAHASPRPPEAADASTADAEAGP